MTAPKTFGQIAWEVETNGYGWDWSEVHDTERAHWERIAAAVAMECALIVEDRKVGLPSFFEIDERLDQAAEAIREAISCSSKEAP